MKATPEAKQRKLRNEGGLFFIITSRGEWHLLRQVIPKNSLIVIPAKAGIQSSYHHGWIWIPAFAGMTPTLNKSRMTAILSLSKCF